MTDQPIEEPPAPDPALDDAREPADVAALKRERDTLQDRLLRTAAEFDNYRKRVDRERREQAESAAASLLTEILPVVDNLERALQAPATSDSSSYRAGVELILRQLLDMLRKRGVTPIEALGTDFDPRVHQAVSQEASETHRDGEVMEELQRGYMLGDRLLRAAMVKVATS
jgi:molecular chaperone GrpE